ncbi:MAG: hypothetical protein M9894_37800 [Planctomycetes bacterium]|nr:hypothetical protein [Planctomycetota bacterium]
MESRTILTCVAALALAGCAAPHTVSTRAPAADPYVVDARAGEADREAAAPRVPGWTDSRHADELGAVAPGARVEVGADAVSLRGPAAEVDAAAAFLNDRARFQGRAVRLEVAQARVRPGSVQFDALDRIEGGAAAAVVPVRQAAGLLAAGAPFATGALTAGDGERRHTHVAHAQRTYVDAQPHDGPPSLSLAHLGQVWTARPSLADAGALLVLDWAQERAVPAGDWPALRVVAGTRSLDVELPALVHQRAAGRFVLRDGEALVIAQALPDAPGEVLLTVVRWAAATPPGA